VGPLEGIKVLDLSRVLAGPWATQALADFGATVYKVEKPASGDDTRHWGPPWLKDRDGRDSGESAYYLAANRGKHSLAIDLSSGEGQALVRALAARADVLVENFKVGGLARYASATPTSRPRTRASSTARSRPSARTGRTRMARATT
jgi:crotonobetainyl-CoA:carnitine CoA-transferase CaiB-like acyl-CoA transferase